MPSWVFPMRNPERTLRYIRTKLLIDYPFFGAVASSLEMFPDSTVPGFSFSDTAIRYNPSFVAQSPLNICIYELAREIARVALSHYGRRGGRDGKIWNLASEIVIGDILQKTGLASGIPRVVYSRRFSGMSVEEVYSEMMILSGIGQNHELTAGDNSSQYQMAADRISTATGITRELILKSMATDAENDRPQSLYSAKMREILASARLVEVMAGKRSVRANIPIPHGYRPVIPWSRILDPFRTPAREERSMRRFSRKYMDSGIYLPYRRNMTVRAVVVMDVSASIPSETAGRFREEIAALGSSLGPGDQVTYLQADAASVHREILSCDNRIPGRIRYGNGGTDFTGVFQMIAHEGHEGPVVLLTDGRAIFPEEVPPFPLICVSTDLPAPYGINYRYGDFA